MSRLARNRGVAPAGSGTASGSRDDYLATAADEICPVCKSSSYLNPNMRFLLNPRCYHKMCASCVDRIFSHGPSQCPVANCGKTLRKHQFRPQVFSDTKMERDVDIRRRVSEVFNRREEEFESLREWNDYLEMVEEITYNLIERIDVEANERKLERYGEANAGNIKTNAKLAREESSSAHARQAAQKEQARLSRAAARREDEEERKELEEGRQRTIDELAKGKGSADAIAMEGENRLKASRLRRAGQGPTPSDASLQGTSTGPGDHDSIVIRGLKKRTEPAPEESYDPFGGLRIDPRYHVPPGKPFDWDWLDHARTDVAIAAGGYDVEAYCQRALCDAMAGLGVFVADDMAARPADTSAASALATAVALPAAAERKKVKIAHKPEDDDVF